MASGLSIGLSIGLGGIAAVALGGVADSVDLRAAMYVTAAAAVPGFLLAALLPSSRVGSAHGQSTRVLRDPGVAS
jgi:hypothetical protein